MKIFHASFHVPMLDWTTHHLRHSYARTISLNSGMALYAHAAGTSYIHTYIREEKRRKNTCWPGKYVAEEKGKARARRKSRQKVIWWGGGMGKRRGAREEREESREKRNCRALKSPKRQGALTKSNTNERKNERTKVTVKASYVEKRRCSVEEGTKDEGKEVVWSRAKRSRSRHRAIDPWNEGVSCGYTMESMQGYITLTHK